MAVDPERSKGQGTGLVPPFQVVVRVVLESQGGEGQIVVSLSQPDPPVGSQREVGVTLDDFPYSGMHTMIYHRLYLCTWLSGSRNGELDKVEREGILSYQVEIPD